MNYRLPCCTNSKLHSIGDTPHNCYSNQESVCTAAYFVYVPIVKMNYRLPCCNYSKPHSSDGIPHNCYCDQQSFCSTCCPVALTVRPREQSIIRTIALETKSKSALIVGLRVSSTLQTAHLKIPLVTKIQYVIPVALLH